MAGQGQITDQVEHFVADEFVVKTKRAILHLTVAENDGIFFRRTPDQPHIPQHLLIFAKAEGAGRGDLGAIGSGSQIDGEGLTADRVREIDVVGDAVAFAGIYGDELAVLAHFDAFQYA